MRARLRRRSLAVVRRASPTGSAVEITPASAGDATSALAARMARRSASGPTAEICGDGATETLVGEALTGLRDDVFLVSKAFPQNAGRGRLERACEASLKRLRTDRLDLYLLHWRGSVPLAETVEGMEALHAASKSEPGASATSTWTTWTSWPAPAAADAPLTRCSTASAGGVSSSTSCPRWRSAASRSRPTAPSSRDGWDGRSPAGGRRPARRHALSGGPGLSAAGSGRDRHTPGRRRRPRPREPSRRRLGAHLRRLGGHRCGLPRSDPQDAPGDTLKSNRPRGAHFRSGLLRSATARPARTG